MHILTPPPSLSRFSAGASACGTLPILPVFFCFVAFPFLHRSTARASVEFHQPWGLSLRSASLMWGPLLSLALSSCTLTSSSASPSQPGKAPSCFGLTSRGKHRHESVTAAGLRRPPQPAQGGPSCFGLTSRGKHRHEGAPAAGLPRPLSQPRGPLTYRAYLARKAPTCGRHRSKTSSFGSASPGNLPHVSGLPREESTDMRVSPQLGFAVLLSQPRGSHHVSGLPREEAPA